MKIVVAIVSHSRPALLRRTLSSLGECTLPSAAIRTLVIENGSQEGTGDLVRSAAPRLNAECESCDSDIKTVALNRLLARCIDELIVFLDDDVRVTPALLQAYSRAASGAGRGHYFGGPTGVDYEVPPPQWLRRYLPASAVGLLLEDQAAPVRYPACFLGFNWAAYADELRACGGFSEDFGPGTTNGSGDESFMQWRLNGAGITGKHVPDAKVWHYVPRDRCSPEWTLGRARSGGFNAGVLTEHWHRANRRRPRRLRLATRQLSRRIVRTDFCDLLLFRPQGRFWARHTATWIHAYLRGMRHGARWRPLDDKAWRASGLQPADGELDITDTRNGTRASPV